MTDDRAQVLVVDDMENMRGLLREILDAQRLIDALDGGSQDEADAIDQETTPRPLAA